MTPQSNTTGPCGRQYCTERPLLLPPHADSLTHSMSLTRHNKLTDEQVLQLLVTKHPLHPFHEDPEAAARTYSSVDQRAGSSVRDKGTYTSCTPSSVCSR